MLKKPIEGSKFAKTTSNYSTTYTIMVCKKMGGDIKGRHEWTGNKKSWQVLES